jgi:hypothetical protein
MLDWKRGKIWCRFQEIESRAGTLALTRVRLRCTLGKAAAQWAGIGPMGWQGQMG